MSPESLVLVAIMVACVVWPMAALIWGYVRGVHPGMKRYRSIVDELRKWRVLEPDEPEGSERVRELALNWARLSRGSELATVVGVLNFALVVGGHLYGPSSIHLRPVVLGFPLEVALSFALSFALYACISLVGLRTSSRAQMPESVATPLHSTPLHSTPLPPYRLYTAAIRPIVRLAMGMVAVLTVLSLGALTGLFPTTDDSSNWVTVRSRPWLALVIPAVILAMLVYCQFIIHHLSRLRPLRLAEDDMLSLRAGVAYLQHQVNALHSFLAVLVALGVAVEFFVLPYVGTVSYVLMFAVIALLFIAVLQPLATSLMTLPPPELFMRTDEPFRQAEGHI